MNIQGLILVGAVYLLGNPQARVRFGTIIQQAVGQGIDALNKMNTDDVHNIFTAPNGGDADVEQPVEQSKE